MKRATLVGVVLVLSCFAKASWGEWNPHTVLELNGEAGAIRLPAKFQIATEKMSRVVLDTYIVYMPERDRLLMLVSCDYPYRAMVLFSKDHGATWNDPRYVHLDADGDPDALEATSLTYLGGGKVLFAAGKKNIKGTRLWYSTDYGETWGDQALNPMGTDWNPFWHPFFVDRDPKTGKTDRIIGSAYYFEPGMDVTMQAGWQHAGLVVSRDEGLTWSKFFSVPQWAGVNEVTLVRAANGDLVAGCRTDWPDRFSKQYYDHNDGLGVSISKDNGKTWSKPNRLYAWGRQHPSMVLLPDNDIVMTYVVRQGYPRTVDGIPQFGVEAVVSHDNGATWDLDHRYILARWPGLTKGPNSWFTSPQNTSTVLMPDGSLLTSFGTGYRSLDPSRKVLPAPRDVGLVSWRVSEKPVNNDQRITDAPWDSELRNRFNPDPERHEVRSECAAAPGKKIISVEEDGARVSTSPSDGRPEYLLHDPYTQPVLTLESLPAWVEIQWPKEHRIDEIHILPGAPEWAQRPSGEEAPLDYRLQYEKEGRWRDLVSPITNAERFIHFNRDDKREYIFTDVEFEYTHKFPVVETRAIRMMITRSSDSGIRKSCGFTMICEPGGKVVVPEDKRETALRAIEVFEANSHAAGGACGETPLRAIEVTEVK